MHTPLSNMYCNGHTTDMKIIYLWTVKVSSRNMWKICLIKKFERFSIFVFSWISVFKIIGGFSKCRSIYKAEHGCNAHLWRVRAYYPGIQGRCKIWIPTVYFPWVSSVTHLSLNLNEKEEQLGELGTDFQCLDSNPGLWVCS